MESLYSNMHQLLSQNHHAKAFFLSLPEDAQGALLCQSREILSVGELHRKAREYHNLCRSLPKEEPPSTRQKNR